MPAEWHRHSATQLQWPSKRAYLAEEKLERIEEIYCKIIEELHFYEPIHLFVEDLETRNRVMQKLSLKPVELDRIIIHQQETNFIRARDCGPVFVQKGDQYVITDWSFNSSVAQNGLRNKKKVLPSFIANKYEEDRVYPDLALRGSDIDVNGDGAILITESVKSDQNPELSKTQIEDKLREYLGVDQIIWLKQGGKETGGNEHMDLMPRWINEHSVVTSVCEDRDDMNHQPLQENLEILRSVKLNNGKTLNVKTLPLAYVSKEAMSEKGADRTPVSYTSFYIANGVVLVPLYDKVYDKQALELFRDQFPGRKVIGIPSQDLAREKTSIHGITLQWHGINTGG